MSSKDLTQEQLAWFMENFEHTKNQKMAERLGTSPRTITRIARELGCQKTKEFMESCQRNASAHAAKVNHAMGGNAGMRNLLIYGKATRFKAGEKIKERMKQKEYEGMLERRGMSRRALFQSERRRVLFGLEQKTNLRVVRCSRKKICLRHNLRKHGYRIERMSNEVWITPDTQRSIIMEERGRKMGLGFIFEV